MNSKKILNDLKLRTCKNLQNGHFAPIFLEHTAIGSEVDPRSGLRKIMKFASRSEADEFKKAILALNMQISLPKLRPYQNNTKIYFFYIFFICTSLQNQ